MKNLIILCLIFLTACSSATKQETPNKKFEYYNLNKEKKKVSKPTNEKQLITNFYKKWEGTPYLWGGTNKSGIDCSALMQVLFEEVYNLSIPRTTGEQMEEGRNCGYLNRQLGDLIFFKTGPSTFHVGIYLENDNFINSSSSNGVSIANLNDPYWENKYLKIRRIRKDE